MREKKEGEKQVSYSVNSAKFCQEHPLGVANGDDSPIQLGDTVWQ